MKYEMTCTEANDIHHDKRKLRFKTMRSKDFFLGIGYALKLA